MLKAFLFTLVITVAAAAQAQEQDQGAQPAPPAPPAPSAGEDEAQARPEAGSEQAPAAPEQREITLDEWQRDDWALVKPGLSLLELDGYFRIRADALRRLDFENGTVTEFVSQNEPAPRYWPAADGKASFTGTNMRLRLEPTINVSEKVQVVTTIDIFDNMVLGTTPETVPPRRSAPGTQDQGTEVPVNVLSRRQQSSVQGVNAITDSILVKRAYVRLTALNEQLELRAGRMPNHWGLGMLFNAGDCLDCDFGQAVDRIALTFRAANHLFTPLLDWVSSGPVVAPFGELGSQSLDAVPWDDVPEYGLRIAKVMHPEDLSEELLQGRTVLTYGLHNSFRRQSRGLVAAYYDAGYDPVTDQPRGEDPADVLVDERRDAFLYFGDGYARLYTGNIELGLELAVIAGGFKDRFGLTANDAPVRTDILQLGGALEALYRVDGNKRGPVLSLKVGGASGDSFFGFGALDFADTQRGQRAGVFDRNLDNFQFSPDYHVDLLLFRHVIGTVTDAWYASPGVSYFFDESVEGKLNAVYSQALFKRSTPSGASSSGADSPGGELPLGLELDAELVLGAAPDRQEQGVLASIAGGVLFPFGAFDNLELEGTDDGPGGKFAWTLQGRLYVTF